MYQGDEALDDVGKFNPSAFSFTGAVMIAWLDRWLARTPDSQTPIEAPPAGCYLSAIELLNSLTNEIEHPSADDRGLWSPPGVFLLSEYGQTSIFLIDERPATLVRETEDERAARALKNAQAYLACLEAMTSSPASAVQARELLLSVRGFFEQIKLAGEAKDLRDLAASDSFSG